PSRVGDQKPNVSIVPCGTDIPFCFIPSTSYWATFIESLPPSPFGLRRTGRDQSFSHTPKFWVDAQGRRPDRCEAIPPHGCRGVWRTRFAGYHHLTYPRALGSRPE